MYSLPARSPCTDPRRQVVNVQRKNMSRALYQDPLHALSLLESQDRSRWKDALADLREKVLAREGNNSKSGLASPNISLPDLTKLLGFSPMIMTLIIIVILFG